MSEVSTVGPEVERGAETIETTSYPEYKPGPITGAQLLALGRFAASDDSRPVLTSIKVAPDHMAAADGYRLAVLHGTAEVVERDPEQYHWRHLLVPFAGIKQHITKKMQRFKWIRNGLSDVQIDCSTEGAGVTTSVLTRSINGTFPDWKQIVPPQSPIEQTVTVNARYLRDVCDLAIALTPKGDLPAVRLNSPVGPAKAYRIDLPGAERVSGSIGVAVIMPMVTTEYAYAHAAELDRQLVTGKRAADTSEGESGSDEG